MRYTSYEQDVDPYEAIRGVLDPMYVDLPPEDIAILVEAALPGISADEFESWLSNIGKAVSGVASKAMPVVSKVLPAALPVVGTMIGGPVGTMIGGVAGQAVGSLLSPGTKTPTVPGKPATAPAPAAAGSSATAQLLQTMFQPEMLQALLAMLLGQSGQKQVNVGGTPVPPSAFANLLGSLAMNAASEYNTLMENNAPHYLMNDDGEFMVDPANPEQRAEALLARLNRIASEQALQEQLSEEFLEEDEPMDGRISALDVYYDNLDLAQWAWEQSLET